MIISRLAQPRRSALDLANQYDYNGERALATWEHVRRQHETARQLETTHVRALVTLTLQTNEKRVLCSRLSIRLMHRMLVNTEENYPRDKGYLLLLQVWRWDLGD